MRTARSFGQKVRTGAYEELGVGSIVSAACPCGLDDRQKEMSVWAGCPCGLDDYLENTWPALTTKARARLRSVRTHRELNGLEYGIKACAVSAYAFLPVTAIKSAYALGSAL